MKRAQLIALIKPTTVASQVPLKIRSRAVLKNVAAMLP